MCGTSSDGSRRPKFIAAADWARYTPGAEVTECRFASLSNPFEGNARFAIRSKRGKNVRPFSAHDREREAPFTADSRFRVLRVEPDPDAGRTIIEMEEL